MVEHPLLELLEHAQERERLERLASKRASESGRTLARARQAAGLSQANFAALAGVSPPYVSQVENGRRPVSTETISEWSRLITNAAHKEVPNAHEAEGSKRRRREAQARP
jgi:transcriptional regulator with XRE-family HTH domain